MSKRKGKAQGDVPGGNPGPRGAAEGRPGTLAARPLVSKMPLVGFTSRPSSTYHLPVNRDIVASSQMPKQQVFELLEEGNIMKKLQRRNRAVAAKSEGPRTTCPGVPAGEGASGLVPILQRDS